MQLQKVLTRVSSFDLYDLEVQADLQVRKLRLAGGHSFHYFGLALGLRAGM